MNDLFDQQTVFLDSTTDFRTKWRLKIERRNSLLWYFWLVAPRREKNHNLSGPEYSHLVDDINMKSGIEAVNQQSII